MLEVYSVVAHEDTRQASRMMPNIVRRAKFERVIVRGLRVRDTRGIEPPPLLFSERWSPVCA